MLKNQDHTKKENLIRLFLDTDGEKYILGRNENAMRLSKLVNVDGYIDDFTQETQWNHKPIVKSNQISNKKAIIVSCSLAIYPHSAINSLEKTGFQNILSVLDIALHSDLAFDVMFMSDAQRDLEVHCDKYENIFNRIKEHKSRDVFKNIMNFRKYFDLSYMDGFHVDQVGQYFEDFLNLKEDEVFVDAGGYDGQTSIEFIKRCPKYKSIYIFEPSTENLKLAKENLKNFHNIHFISKGLSNQKETLKFDTSSGSASSISENGTIEIDVDTLDALVNETVTFIKMDIEGTESLAIEGMRKHILKDYPKMAISVYHKVDDLWKIPEQILAIRNDYDIYLRHYTEGTDETVMFFIPRSLKTIKESE